MKKNAQLIITGGAGFIGSNLVRGLNEDGFDNIIIVDNLDDRRKEEHLKQLQYKSYLDRNEFIEKIRIYPENFKETSAIIHMGACSDTTQSSKEFLFANNTEYSKTLYKFCVDNSIRFIYASSAATYGDGSNGYNDTERKLEPLNLYGYSKYVFDEWVMNNSDKPPQWVGLKFFNVYGPNEDHKDRMASVVFHGYGQIQKTGKMTLFKSHKQGYADGEQQRDFIYVKDIVSVVKFFLSHPEKSGIFNVGTGKARTFLDLANAIFQALNMRPHITFIAMPGDLQPKYQYYTQANMNSLKKAGYAIPFTELEEGVRDYVNHHLIQAFQ